MPERILVVDDEPVLLKNMVRELATFQVVATQSLQEALGVLARGEVFVAVVSDFNLGSGATGLDLLAEVRQRTSACCRILVSASTPNKELKSAVLSGLVQRLVAKPWSPGELSRIVRDAIDSRPPG